MPAATYRAAPRWDAPSPARRGSGLAFALAATALILLALLGSGAVQKRFGKPLVPLVVDLITADSPPAASRAPVAVPRPPPPHPVDKPPPPLPRVLPPVAKPLDILILSREDFAAAEISKLGRQPGEPGAGTAGDSREVGRAPNGEALYNAEWQRRPTDAELGGYLPRGAPEGWGLIACKTAPDFRVEDCVELGNDPPGSRLASAVRQAAWQFRVRPPRKGGRALIGAWVQIRIDYSRAAAAD